LFSLKIPRAADQVNILYQLLMMVTIIFYFRSVPFAPFFIFFHIVVILLLVWLTQIEKSPFVKIVKDFNPVLIIPLNFTELHYLVHNVNPVDFDQALIIIDKAIFGVHPTVWLEQFSNPILTEYFQIIYTTFYFLPIILAIILYNRGEFENFHYFVFIMVFGFYASYIGYFLIPAIGPRFTLDHLQTEAVTGLWLTEGIRHTLDTLENIQRDAFPSGHTEMTLLTMFYAWRYSKKYFWILMVVGNSLILSTVYLRYHYVVDVVAGIFLAILVAAFARPIYNRLEEFRNRK